MQTVITLKASKPVKILMLFLFSRYSISETASEEESPVPSCSCVNSESSVPEELGSPAAESVPSATMGHGQPESPDQSAVNEDIIYSEDFKSSTSPDKLVSELFMLYKFLNF